VVEDVLHDLRVVGKIQLLQQPARQVLIVLTLRPELRRDLRYSLAVTQEAKNLKLPEPGASRLRPETRRT